MNWIETHGLECLVAAYIFSQITSAMPPLPMNRGWWEIWLYNVLQILGANAGNLVKHTPQGALVENAIGVSQTKTLTSSTTTTAAIATGVVESPKA